MAQDAPATPGTIKVVGNGVAVGSPDVATVEVSIDEFDPILSKALERANTKAAAVIEALQAVIPAENIQTTNFNVWVDQGYDLEGRPNGDFTYQVQHSLQLKTENFDQIEVVLQTALDNGATQVYGLTFGVGRFQRTGNPSADERSRRCTRTRPRTGRHFGCDPGVRPLPCKNLAVVVVCSHPSPTKPLQPNQVQHLFRCNQAPIPIICKSKSHSRLRGNTFVIGGGNRRPLPFS